MAKKSSIENNKKRIRMVSRKKATKEALKSKFMNKGTTPEERQILVFKMSEMPRNASKVRIRNRCALTGRTHGYYKKFGLSRIKLRDLASKAQLPGVTKASW